MITEKSMRDTERNQIRQRGPFGLLATLRRDGWMVAVHNDYRQDGELRTFWLMTKGERAVKGEGRTDEEALLAIVDRVLF
jgi:hypothetical protein